MKKSATTLSAAATVITLIVLPTAQTTEDWHIKMNIYTNPDIVPLFVHCH